MRHIKVFVSSTEAHEILAILNGVTKKMMIPLRMFDSGVGPEGSGQIWIKFEICDNNLRTDVIADRIDRLNNKGKYADCPDKWVMPCEIHFYDSESQCFEPGSPDRLS